MEIERQTSRGCEPTVPKSFNRQKEKKNEERS